MNLHKTSTDTPPSIVGVMCVACDHHDVMIVTGSTSQMTSYIDCASTCTSVYMARHHNICLSSAGRSLSFQDVNISGLSIVVS